MFVKFALAMTLTGSLALFATTPAFAYSSPLTFSGAENAAYMCAKAAAAAEMFSTATKGDLATCSVAISLAGDSKGPLAAALTNRGVLYLARGEYAATIADSNEALQINHDLSEAMVNRGTALMLSGKPKIAVDDLTRALAMAPAHAERAYFNRAMAREDMGDLMGAYLDYRKASELDPMWDGPKKELARFTVVRRSPTS